MEHKTTTLANDRTGTHTSETIPETMIEIPGIKLQSGKTVADEPTFFSLWGSYVIIASLAILRVSEVFQNTFPTKNHHLSLLQELSCHYTNKQ